MLHQLHADLEVVEAEHFAGDFGDRSSLGFGAVEDRDIVFRDGLQHRQAADVQQQSREEELRGDRRIGFVRQCFRGAGVDDRLQPELAEMLGRRPVPRADSTSEKLSASEVTTFVPSSDTARSIEVTLLEKPKNVELHDFRAWP